MARGRDADVPVRDLQLVDPDGQPVALGALGGVSLLVLMRHRH